MDIEQLAQTGCLSKLFAREKPDQIALRDMRGTRTFKELHDNANRLARAFSSSGLEPGDAVAVLSSNRCEFVEILLATQRSGLRLTPVNWHLSHSEAEYIIKDCEARVLLAEAQFLDLNWISSFDVGILGIAIGGPSSEFRQYTDWISDYPADELETSCLGSILLYTSGTTGRPKGVLKRHADIMMPQWSGSFADYRQDHDVQLCCGPCYHAAPLFFDIRWPLASGVPIILLDKWDSENVLRLIEEHGVTHMHMVPIMFQRLLVLSDEGRATADVSSLKRVFHGAAPCPIETKRKMIEWFGPIVYEYYGGSEGSPGVLISSQEWLDKPGSVGRITDPTILKIVDDQGNAVPPGVDGEILHRVNDDNAFEYFKDIEKTAAQRKGGYFTLGDVGRLDEDGYLYLTGRTAECIISGGVNISPTEVDQVLISHPDIADVCTFGIPNEEWGEEVRAAVQLEPGVAPSNRMKKSILEYATQRLSKFKCPRSIDFVVSLPRLPSGKILREKVRAPYWEKTKGRIRPGRV